MQTDAKFGEDGSDGHCCSSAAVRASGSGPALVGLTGQMLLGKDEKSLTHPRNNGSHKDDIRVSVIGGCQSLTQTLMSVVILIIAGICGNPISPIRHTLAYPCTLALGP